MKKQLEFKGYRPLILHHPRRGHAPRRSRYRWFRAEIVAAVAAFEPRPTAQAEEGERDDGAQ